MRVGALVPRLLAAAATGAMVFLASPDWDLWPLAWIAFVPLLQALRDVTPRRAVLLGFVAGLVTHAGGFYWIPGLLVRFGHLPWAVGGFLWLLLAAYQGLAFAGFAWAYVRVRATLRLPAALVAPIAMAVFDFAVPQIFPCYLGIALAWVPPAIQIAELTGPVGVTFLMVLSAAALWDLIWRRAWRPAAATAAVIALAIGFGALRMRQIDARRTAAPHRKVGAVQANVGIREKGRAEDAARQHELHLRLTRELERAGADLVVWPESSYPYYYWRDATSDWPPDHPWRLMKDLRTPVLFGTITYGRGEKRPYNSTLLARADGSLDGPYDKVFLLLFGEYVPFYDELNIRKWVPASSNFARGEGVRLFEVGDMRVGNMICFEDIIPGFARKIADLGPNLFVNTTNDAWFGATSEPWEHMALAVFRSVEHRVDLIRSVNTGVTAHIDAAGRVVQKTRPVDPSLEPGAPPMTMLADVALLDPSGLYGTAGDTFGYLCVAALAAMLLVARRRAAPAPATEKRRKRRKQR